MKNVYKYCFFLVFLTIALVSSKNLTAQNPIYNWQLGFGVGYTNYYGDLSNYRIHGADELYKIYRFGNYNSHYQQQPSFSLLLQKKITPTLGIMFQANYLQFSMSDRYRKNNGDLDSTSPYFSRALNFRTTMQDVGFAFSFSPNNGRIGSEKAFFYPSFYLGLGVSKFVVKGDLYDGKNNPYNYGLATTVTDDNYETNLRDARTELDQKFRDVEPYVDLGLALNFRLSQRFILSFQSDIKYSASDYLDDVSGTYKSAYPTAVEAYASKPGTNIVNPVTLQRGDNNGVNDFYINNRVVLSISLARNKTVTRFQPPVIYSLNTRPYAYQKRAIDSVKKSASQDSLKHLRIDSTNTLLKDSLLILKTSVASTRHDSTVNQKLDSINADLTVIKQLLYDQQVRPRLAQLQYQSDSVKILKNRLMMRRPLNESGKLLLRIYDLQLDSLRNEYGKVPRSKYAAFNKTDSGAKYIDTSKVAYNNLISTSYDTLNTGILQYQNTEQQDARQKKIDSIQKRLTVLEAVEGRTDTVTNTVRISNPSDSINNLRSREEARIKLQQKDQDIASLKQQLSTFKDSADYYKTRKQVAPVLDTVQKRLPWYQRYLGIGNKKSKKAKLSADTLLRADDATQQRFYESETSLANTKIDNIEQEKADLAVQRINYVRENNLVLDSIERKQNEMLLQSRIQQNNGTIKSLQQQVQRSNDSAAYYKQLMLTTNDQPIVTDRKWYQRVFSSDKQTQNNIDAQRDLRDNNLRQQQNYDNTARNLQDQINNLQRRNNDLQDAARSYNSERYYNRQPAYPPVTPVIAVVGNGANNAGEVADLRAQLQNLQNELNYDSRNRPLADTAHSGKTPQIILLPAPATQPVNIKSDSSELSALKMQLNFLKARMDSLANKPSAAVPEKIASRPAPQFDVAGFPVISVYFKLGSTVLSGDQLNKIMPFARVANKNASAAIIIKGFTDPVGSPAKNILIANKRSEYIKNTLVNKYKIEDNRITIEDPEQSGSGAKKANPLDRRVDLQFK